MVGTQRVQPVTVISNEGPEAMSDWTLVQNIWNSYFTMTCLWKRIFLRGAEMDSCQ